ncbi:DUF3789 domain-containing protein [Neobacillus sp. Marseille-QA0830]
MFAFAAGLVTGSFFMLVIMSLMTAAKEADRHIELSVTKE